ncbi:MAG: cobalamin-independent methionine synthase II family protein [Pseudomonadota bacterium]
MRNTDFIQTTHVGSLPRSKAVTDLVFAQEAGEAIDPDEFNATIKDAVKTAVGRQKDAGITVVSDGEMSKISYATYIKDRITGFEGDSPRRAPSDLEEFPAFLERQAKSGGTPTYKRPTCVGAIEVKSMKPLEDDLANFSAALDETGGVSGFMNAVSPGTIALFQPNEYYDTHDDYLEALAEAMRPEYEAIVEAGLQIQLDCPDLALGRHMMFKDRSDEEFVKSANKHVDALNHALRNVPKDKVKMHMCWGNYEGPHHHDAPMGMVLPVALRAKIGGLSFEHANPRHAHEWKVFEAMDIPEDLTLIPGVIDSTTHFIEHPELVAQRIETFTNLVGRERVIAGSDCGFSTFAGYNGLDEEIVYAKLGSMSEGARIASERLWA